MAPDVQSYLMQLPQRLQQLASPELFYELGILLVAGVVAWLIHRTMRDTLHAGLEVVSCGANVPFADSEIFFGPIGEWLDEKVSLIPDFIANCGMARVFAYLMSDHAILTDEAIFSDVSNTIHSALRQTFEKRSSKNKVAETSLEIALKQLV